jgi:very-short-patch-repair endonuclease
MPARHRIGWGASFCGEHDLDRTNYLERQGIKVIRFENQAIHDNIDFVVEIIRQNLRQTIPAKPERNVQ